VASVDLDLYYRPVPSALVEVDLARRHAYVQTYQKHHVEALCYNFITYTAGM
jgi:hypothetical protein